MLIHNIIKNKGMPQNQETLSLKGNTLEYMFAQCHSKNRKIMSLDAVLSSPLT